jgi:MtN3 and saliva related transmembrane protein
VIVVLQRLTSDPIECRLLILRCSTPFDRTMYFWRRTGIIRTDMPDLIGWISSCILLVTIAEQVHKQFRDDTSRGVSTWLFIGEMASAIGFLTYSILLGITVYIVTNSIMILNAILGLAITIHHRRRERSQIR